MPADLNRLIAWKGLNYIYEADLPSSQWQYMQWIESIQMPPKTLAKLIYLMTTIHFSNRNTFLIQQILIHGKHIKSKTKCQYIHTYQSNNTPDWIQTFADLLETFYHVLKKDKMLSRRFSEDTDHLLSLQFMKSYSHVFTFYTDIISKLLFHQALAGTCF